MKERGERIRIILILLGTVGIDVQLSDGSIEEPINTVVRSSSMFVKSIMLT
jgi:hypothetical protein